MKKIIHLAVAATIASLSATAMACPKGTTLQGGTGPNHKGGKCVATLKQDVKTDVKKVDTKVKADAAKADKALKTDIKKVDDKVKVDAGKVDHTVKTDVKKIDAKAGQTATVLKTDIKQDVKKIDDKTHQNH